MRPSRLALIAAAALVAVAAVWWFQDPTTPVSPTGNGGDPVAANGAGGTLPPAAGGGIDDDLPRVPVRVDQTPSRLEPPRGWEQGLSGRVLDQDGNPMVDVPVYLVDLPDMEVLLRSQRTGVRYPPVAARRTDGAGRFNLGMPAPPPDRRFDLRILPEDGRHGDFQRSDLRVLAGSWIDLGDIRLPAPGVLTGRITTLGGDLAVPEAGVRIYGAGAIDAIALPGRDDGLLVRADATGRYRCETVPPGPIVVEAFGTGFAGARAFDRAIVSGEVTRLDFALERSQQLSGVILGADGLPLPGATVHGRPEDREHLDAPTCRTVTDGDGRFTLDGTRNTPHTLVVTAPGHMTARRRSVRPGTPGLQIPLTGTATAFLQVLAADGRRVERFGVRACFQFSGGGIGTVPGWGTRWFGPSDLTDGAARIEDLPPAEPGDADTREILLRIEVPGAAPAFSEPFLPLPGPPTRITVTMVQGAEVRGILLDAGGTPVAAAELAIGPVLDLANPLAATLAPLVQTRETRAVVRTDGTGSFVLQNLSAGRYQLVVQHREFGCRILGPFTVRAGDSVDLPVETTTLQPGAIASGRVLVAGTPTAQVQVAVIPGAGAPPCARYETVTDNEGRWLLPSALPPGTYTFEAARPSDDGPIGVLTDRATSRREIQVDQAAVTLDLVLPARN